MRQLSCLLLLCALGCSGGGADKPLPLYPVTGSLIVGGKPLENVFVQLLPVDLTSKAKPGAATTDAEGKFVIRTNGDKGANPGKYKVVLGTSGAAANPNKQVTLEEATKMSGQYAKTRGIPVETLPYPKEWGTAATTPKEVEVTDKAVVVNIDI